MIEAVVETYLVNCVRALGGDVRKVAWIGRRHAPDRLILLPGRHALAELKRPKVGARSGQLREHDRLRTAGFEVAVLSTFEEVDAWLEAV